MQGMQCLLACLLAWLPHFFLPQTQNVGGKIWRVKRLCDSQHDSLTKKLSLTNSKDTSFFHKNSRVLIFNAFFGFVMIALHLQW
jgi:hypothetical protein